MAYTPIDMANYPYKTGDKLPCGIEITQVIRGTAEDSFKGYAYREKIVHPRTGRISLSEELTISFRGCNLERVDERGRLCDDDFVYVGVVGDPQAQGVWAKVPGNDKVQFLRPQAFLDLVDKMNKQIEKANKAEEKPKGKTK